MTKEVLNAELNRGDDSLRSAIVLMRESLCLDAMSRCYYAVLHYTRAMLLLREISPKSHHGAFLLFSQQFVKTGDVSQEYGKILARQQKLREEADYSTDASFSVEDVTAALEDVEKFRTLAYQSCASTS
ncbi:MAG: HEPN domain-containing protein [Deltaproteobacteria bacterium]